MGSEMCIRDSEKAKAEAFARNQQAAKERKEAAKGGKGNKKPRQPVIPR